MGFEGRLRAARELAATYTPLYPQSLSFLPKAVVFSNLSEFNADFHRHYNTHVYPDRVAQTAEVGLVRWPSGTVVLGRDGFPTWVNGTLVEEQTAPWLTSDLERLEKSMPTMTNHNAIPSECILVARYGEGTWGHWLGEILPRAVIAEEFFPGRFTFAVPAWTTDRNGSGLAGAIIGSLSAYGINADRLVRLNASESYSFASLHTVTSVRSDRAMHPQVLELMREKVSAKSSALGCYLPSRLALLRKDVGRRGISNFAEVELLLESRGFFISESERLSFEAQVAVFRSAHDVFCVLGSGLTNVIFSPCNVNVIAPAPEAWGDSFFYPLIQARKGKFADIRGACTEIDENVRRDSKFAVPIDQLEAALDLMRIS